jgi:hypothetical protein
MNNIGNGLNVANATDPFSPSNCVPYSTSANVWNLLLFFGANVLAHAATIHSRTGATKMNSFRRMLFMLVAPITAGTVAVHAIFVFILGIKRHGIKWAHFLSSKEELKEAIPAGAVGVLIPRDLAPVLSGRWKLVGGERHSLLLNHRRTHSSGEAREPHIPDANKHLEFILPPDSKLPGYEGYKFYSSSSSANELIAVVQLIYGIYQLVANYGSEIQTLGLSSPYICVIPYLFMSLVNLLANVLMPSYSHVVILPPERGSSEHISRRSSMSSTLSLGSRATTFCSSSKASTEDKETKEVVKEVREVVAEGKEKQHHKITTVRKKTWSCGVLHATKEFSWDGEYMSLTNYIQTYSTDDHDSKVSPAEEQKFLEQRHPHLAFITYLTRWGKKWGLRRAATWSRETNPTKEKERELEDWLTRHYPGVQTNIHTKPLRVYQYSRYIAVILTLIVTTAILGLLTRFRFMVAIDAGRFIAWIYVPPTLLCIPFLVLELNGTTARFYSSLFIVSRYVLCEWI